jgi:hypothetical protein
MTDDSMNEKTIYNSSDVAVLLKIQESTLRKYCLLLEEQGYKFLKNDQGHRSFFDKDVIVLRKITEIKKHPDMTLKQSVSAVIAWIKESHVSEDDITDITENDHHNARDNYQVIHQMEEFIKQQEAFNKELLNRLDQQQKYIEDSLERRDKTLMQNIREMAEARKLVAAAQQKQEEKNKKWWKFWK